MFYENQEAEVFVIYFSILGLEDMPVGSEDEADELRNKVRRTLLKQKTQSEERTVAPRDHMSVGGPHLRFNIASGLRNIATPIG